MTERECPICGARYVTDLDRLTRFGKGSTCSRICSYKYRVAKRPKPKLRGGQTVHSNGYIQIRTGGRYVMRSHLVWDAAHPDDPVLTTEVIHHVNKIKDDDRPENLQKFPSQREHNVHHKTGWKQSADHVAKRVAAVAAARRYEVKSCGKAHSSCRTCRPDLYPVPDPVKQRTRRLARERVYNARRRGRPVP